MPMNGSDNGQTLTKPASGEDHGQPEANDMQIGGNGGSGRPRPKPKPKPKAEE